MKLAPKFKTVTAVFDSPVEYTPSSYSDLDYFPQHRYNQGFTVGPFQYMVTIERDPLNRERNNYLITFNLHRIKNPSYEILERIHKATGVWPRPEDLAQFNRTGWGFGVLDTGNASQVFGNVVKIIEEFLRQYPVDCLQFDAYEESRSDLYRALVRRFARGSKVYEKRHRETPDRGEHREFNVCFDRQTPARRDRGKNKTPYLPGIEP